MTFFQPRPILEYSAEPHGKKIIAVGLVDCLHPHEGLGTIMRSPPEYPTLPTTHYMQHCLFANGSRNIN